MDKIANIINKIKTEPGSVDFQDVIKVIDESYDYIATRFINGAPDQRIINAAGENEGSCKIFSFAKMNKLDVEQTLNCFGQYYRNDVLGHPENTDHANIRTFIKYGWDYIDFENPALTIIEK